MDIVIGASVFAGITATFAITALLYSFRSLLPRRFNLDMLFLIGSVVTTKARLIYPAGIAIHLFFGIILAIGHAAIYAIAGLESGLAWWGLLLGLVQWIVAGLAIERMARVHPHLRNISIGGVFRPQYLLASLKDANVVAFLIVHLLYGLIVGGFYEALV